MAGGGGGGGGGSWVEEDSGFLAFARSIDHRCGEQDSCFSDVLQQWCMLVLWFFMSARRYVLVPTYRS